jgi:TRAP transporter TAXI family solute receptor
MRRNDFHLQETVIDCALHAVRASALKWRERQMSRFFGFVFATCFLAIWTSTTVSAPNPDWPKSVTLASGSPGGTFYIFGEAVTKILSESLKIEVNDLPTGGSEHNVKLVESGGAQLALLSMGTGLQGWNGTGDWTSGQRYRKMRALFPMYDQPFQFVTLRRSGITTLAQFNNRNVGTGPRAGVQSFYIPAILAAVRVTARIGYGSWDSAVNGLLEGGYEAIVTLTGVPMPALKQAEAKEPLVFVSPTPEQIEAIRKAMPELTVSQIGSGVYTSLDKTDTTVGMYAFAIGRDDLPDDLVYQLVKAVFENQPRLVKVTSAASDTLPENAVKNTFLPFHPGAVRYYREIGIKIPDALVPTN